MEKILIKGSRLVTENGVQPADLLIAGEKIERIAPRISKGSGAREIIAEGMYTFPGLVDPHVHFELPAYGTVSSDDFHSGSCAAAAGGVTTFIDFAIPGENQSIDERIKEKEESANSKSIIDYSFHGQITAWSDGKADEMNRATEYGVTSFKIFMPATQGWGVDDGGLYEALSNSVKLKSLIMVHAENRDLVNFFTSRLISQGNTAVEHYGESRPNVAEQEAVVRVGVLAGEARAPVYICHLSTAGAMTELRRLKKMGADIIAETCPHYLLLTEDKLKQKTGYLYACCPPLRRPEDNYELWRGVLEGSVDVIGTDHCPFTKAQKGCAGAREFPEIPLGLPGVENSLSLLYTEGVTKRKMDITDIYRITSLHPAKVFGLYPRKGTLKEGSDADITIFNPSKKTKINYKHLHTECDWSPYQGNELQGCPEYTISRGEVVYHKGKITANKGRGQFLKRKSCQYFY